MEPAAEAAREGNLQYFQTLDVDELAALCRKRDEDRRSLLHSATASGNLELVQHLAERSPPDTVSGADEAGWTPLMSACICGHVEIARLLLSLGADAGAANTQGRTALHYAASKGSVDVVRLLLENSAPATAKDCTGAIPLHRAAGAGRAEALRLLLDATPKHMVDARDETKSTPLLLAAGGGHQAAALLLASRGADVEAEDGEGETPLGAAAVHGALRAALGALAKGEKTLDDFEGLV